MAPNIKRENLKLIDVTDHEIYCCMNTLYQWPSVHVILILVLYQFPIPSVISGYYGYRICSWEIPTATGKAAAKTCESVQETSRSLLTIPPKTEPITTPDKVTIHVEMSDLKNSTSVAAKRTFNAAVNKSDQVFVEVPLSTKN